MWYLSCIIFLFGAVQSSEWPWESTESPTSFINRNATRECGVIPKFNREKCDSAEATQTFFGQYPWHAAIVLRPSYTFLCSGALVSNDAVVTSASCIANPLQSREFPGMSSIRVRLGDWDIMQHNRPMVEPFQHLELPLERIVVHPGYDPSLPLPRFDIAVLLLSEPVQWDEYPHVAPVCLPDPQMGVDLTKVNCWVAGWSQSPSTFAQNCCGGRLVRRGSPKVQKPRASVADEKLVEDDDQFGDGKNLGSDRFPPHFDALKRSKDEAADDQKGRTTRETREDAEADETPLRNDTRDRRQAPRGDTIPLDDMPSRTFSLSPTSLLLHHSQVSLIGPRRCSHRLRRPLGDDVFCAVATNNRQPACIGDAGAGIVCALPPPEMTVTQPWRQRRQADAEGSLSLFRVSTPPMPADARRVQVTLVGTVSRPATCQMEEVVVATDLFEMFQFVASQLVRPRF